MSVAGPWAEVAWRTGPTTGRGVATGAGRLGPSERARLEGICHPRVRQRYVASRLLLHDTVAACQPGRCSGGIDVVAGASGRPELVGRHDLDVSIAHTRGLAVVAVSAAGPVGIDVEPLARRDLPPAGAWVAPVEQERLPPGTCSRDLLMLWVAKEAALKATDGFGPVGRLGVVVDLGAGGPRAQVGEPEDPGDVVLVAAGQGVVTVTGGPGQVEVALRWYEVAGGHLVALAQPLPRPTPRGATGPDRRRTSATPVRGFLRRYGPGQVPRSPRQRPLSWVPPLPGGAPTPAHVTDVAH